MAETPINDPLIFAKALADETRQRIMSCLCCRWLNVGELVEAVGGVTQPTVSHHLALLREAGLVEMRQEGKNTFYTLNQQRVAVCCGNLVQVYAPQSEAAKTLRDCCD
jgi:ArsR family transcriptional regulator